MLHHQLAHLDAGQLGVSPAAQLGLDLLHHLGDPGGGDVPLLAGVHQALEELGPVKVLAAPVLLDDIEGDRLDPLVGGETLPAAVAGAPAPNRLTGLRVTGVHDPEVVVVAVWAAHAHSKSNVSAYPEIWGFGANCIPYLVPSLSRTADLCPTCCGPTAEWDRAA